MGERSGEGRGKRGKGKALGRDRRVNDEGGRRPGPGSWSGAQVQLLRPAGIYLSFQWEQICWALPCRCGCAPCSCDCLGIRRGVSVCLSKCPGLMCQRGVLVARDRAHLDVTMGVVCPCVQFVGRGRSVCAGCLSISVCMPLCVFLRVGCPCAH